MHTVTNTTRPRKPLARTVRLKLAPSEYGPGIINITAGKVSQDYFFLSFPTDFGRGFLLEKTGGEDDTQYHVNVNGADSRCECDGFLNHGMACNGGTGCKHIGALRKLMDEGKL